MVVGPLGEATRVGAGLAIGARLRTTFGSGAAGTEGLSGAAVSFVGALGSSGFTTRLTRAGGASTIWGSATTAAAFLVPVALVAFTASSG